MDEDSENNDFDQEVGGSDKNPRASSKQTINNYDATYHMSQGAQMILLPAFDMLGLLWHFLVTMPAEHFELRSPYEIISDFLSETIEGVREPHDKALFQGMKETFEKYEKGELTRNELMKEIQGLRNDYKWKTLSSTKRPLYEAAKGLTHRWKAEKEFREATEENLWSKIEKMMQQHDPQWQSPLTKAKEKAEKEKAEKEAQKKDTAKAQGQNQNAQEDLQLLNLSNVRYVSGVDPVAGINQGQANPNRPSLGGSPSL